METIPTEELGAFVAVARAGSFTRAAEELGTRKAQVSRVVRRLEERLGVRLLQRTTRAVSLTEVGRGTYERARGILGALDETVRAARDTQAEPSGTLRLTCGVEFGVLAVQRWIGRYLERHPQVRVEAELTNRVVDLVHEGFDVAIRVGALDDSQLVARRLGEVHYGFFAARDTLRRHRAPRTPEELAGHRLVLSTQTRHRPGQWMLEGPEGARVVRLEPTLLVSTHLAVREAVLAGLGIGLLPRFQVRDAVERGAVVQVLPGWSRPGAPVHALFTGSRFMAPKVRAFVDEAARAFEELEGPARGPRTRSR